ncbi:lytic polysaccharide monooxygenase [Gilvimarinus xylanilyticus]|uniref:Lytic polysaccharide monooxygenase n=1 Tax=Gilvimarinus xylanilyticus TaxID=2944139 RepID=A0A9X2KVB9_9GAMM|nr:lytic polysaccharide monooxygenase [Gilvimarinus xylanilyticus]MCP8897900.1 lytic polysaccharide monooxygenase [Gilvimarinus xylanilyticus]
MNIQRLTTHSLKAALLGCVTVASVATTHTVSAHGTVTSPASRIWNCKEEGPETLSSDACIAARAESGSQQFYDWNGIRQGAAGGNHTSVVPDGQLCSGGDPNTFGGMDLARNDWKATPVSGSQTFNWYNSAAHATEYYRYYITKPGYDPLQPLGWDDLELLKETPPEAAEFYPSHTVSLPQRSGRHVVYAVWQRSDSPEAFYACVDVVFNGDGGGYSSSSSSSSSVASSQSSSSSSSEEPSSSSSSAVSSDASSSSSSSTGGGENTCIGVPNWNSGTVYDNGDQVRYNNNRYEAKWWTQGDVPADSTDSWEAWIDQGNCAGS